MSVSAAVVAVLALVMTGQEAATTTCRVPEVPAVERPVKPERPPTPSCVNEATNRHTCSNRVIAAYEGQVKTYSDAFDAYVAAVNAYVMKLNAYAEAAGAYGQCEQTIVAPSRFIQG